MGRKVLCCFRCQQLNRLLGHKMVSGLKMCNLKDDVTIAVNLSAVATKLSEFRIGDCKFKKKT